MKRLFRFPSIAPDRVARDVRSEIGFHLEMRAREFAESGLGPEAARAAALQAFGDVGDIEVQCRGLAVRRAREHARRATMNGLVHDLRFAFRTLKKSLGFTFVALVTLGLGIGANTAIFSMIRGVLLRPLPYAEGDRLVYLRQPAALAGVENSGFSAQELADYQGGARTLEGIAEYHSMPFILLGRGEPRRVQTGVVSANFFDLLGVRPVLGRAFRVGEDQPGAEPVLVLSYGFWRSHLGGDPGIVGRTFEMNDRIHTVVGVLPPVPQYPRENDVYLPISACPFRMAEAARQDRDARMLTLFGRLRSGVTLNGAQNELDAIAGRLHTQYPEHYRASQGYETKAVSLQEELTRRARPTLLMLLGTAAFVLLIACANVANLSLARLLRREREIALRAALGADRARILRQLLTEGAVLALAGGVVGLLLARSLLGMLTAFAARFTPRAGEIALDGSVLLFALAISLLTGLAFTILPALPSRLNLSSALKEGGASTAGARSSRLRGALVVAQVAVSVMLLVGAGLMLRSLLALQRVDLGFETENVLTMTLDLNWSKYDTPELVRRFHQSLGDRLESAPGIMGAASAMSFPLGGSRALGFELVIEGRAKDDRAVPQAEYRSVSPDYFRVMGIPLLEGRVFTEADGAEVPQVAVVNRTLARRYWDDKSPLGHRISDNNGETWATVVGVIGDVRHDGLAAEPSDEVYWPFAQAPIRQASLLVRTRGNPRSAARLVNDAVHSIDPYQPLANIRALEEVRGEALASPRLTATLIGVFAVLALLITAAGLAGVVSFSVSQRTQEIGVRMALGAAKGEVLLMVLREGMRLVLIGLLVGAVGAVAVARLMTGLLYGVEATDPTTFGVMALLLVGVATVACLAPARRAATVDPMIALRST
jgi:putative ABC transport system permease protein